MRIGLIDCDRHNAKSPFPNLPLMKLSAWHKNQGDTVEWYSPWVGRFDRVYVAKVFSLSPDYEYCINADEVIRGGSGYAISLEDGKEVYDKTKDAPLPDDVEHIFPDYSIYGAEKAYGFLTRGCPRQCHFCHIANMQGTISHKVADLQEFWNGQKEIVLLDPNILACPHCEDLLSQVAESKAKVDFSQGLDARLLNEKRIELLNQIPQPMIHFAWDYMKEEDAVLKGLKLYHDMGAITDKRRRLVYVLTNYDTTMEQDLYRINKLREMDYQPYVMIYDKEHCTRTYRRLQRWVNNKFVFEAVPTFEEYNR